jgi:hypothetical protein
MREIGRAIGAARDELGRGHAEKRQGEKCFRRKKMRLTNQMTAPTPHAAPKARDNNV